MVPHAASGRRNRLTVAAFFTVVAAVVAPAVRDRASFPLSTYPIYAHTRARNIVINVAVGVDADGTGRPLGLDAIADTDDPLIAQSTLDEAVARGRAEELCRLIASRSGTGVAAVEIAREEHDLIERVGGRYSIRNRDVIAQCDVIR